MPVNRQNPWKNLHAAIENEQDSRKAQARVTPIIYLGEVVSTDDPKQSNRVKVRIHGLEPNRTEAELPWCEPAMQSLMHIVPLVGETVLIIARNPWAIGVGDRFYIGPIFSQNIAESFDETIIGLGFQNPKEQ